MQAVERKQRSEERREKKDMNINFKKQNKKKKGHMKHSKRKTLLRTNLYGN